jgi:predicted nuclease of predicted toxin-antitoxin system
VKVLFDHNVPRQLRRSLPGHEIHTAKEMGWAELENGELLDAAQASGFDVMVTGDKRLSREQHLEGRSLALVVLGTTDRKLLERDTAPVVAAVERSMPGSFEALPAPEPQRRSPSPSGP